MHSKGSSRQAGARNCVLRCRHLRPLNRRICNEMSTFALTEQNTTSRQRQDFMDSDVLIYVNTKASLKFKAQYSQCPERVSFDTLPAALSQCQQLLVSACSKWQIQIKPLTPSLCYAPRKHFFACTSSEHECRWRQICYQLLDHIIDAAWGELPILSFFKIEMWHCMVRTFLRASFSEESYFHTVSCRKIDATFRSAYQIVWYIHLESQIHPQCQLYETHLDFLVSLFQKPRFFCISRRGSVAWNLS